MIRRPLSRPPGFVKNFLARPLLFIGSALGLLAVAALKGGLGAKRGTGKGG